MYEYVMYEYVNREAHGKFQVSVVYTSVYYIVAEFYGSMCFRHKDCCRNNE